MSLKSDYRMSACPVHGETKFNGEHCQKCVAESRFVIRECSEHGLTKHAGETCQMCVASKSKSFRYCRRHGEVTAHIGDRCRRCITESISSVKVCPVHGESPHRGSSCNVCVGERVAHNRWHVKRGVLGEDCRLCAAEPLIPLTDQTKAVTR